MNPSLNPASSQLSIGNEPVQQWASRTIKRDLMQDAARATRAPLPPSTLFMGLAEDGMPALLNLRDPGSYPVLVAADAGAGKTRLLRTIASDILARGDPGRTRFAVISERPGEWRGLDAFAQCDAVLPFHSALTSGYLHCVAAGPPPAPGTAADLILLIDGFEALASDGDLRDAALTLLRSPAPSGVFPFVSLNTSAARVPAAWLESFPVRILGYIRDRHAAATLQPGAELLAGNLQPPCQFAAPYGGSWLPFWLPDPQ